MFLDELQMAWAEEWEKIIGALEVARASSIVGTDTCDRSTIMPRRFISDTTSCNWKKIGKICDFLVYCKWDLVVINYRSKMRQSTDVGNLPWLVNLAAIWLKQDTKRLSVAWYENFVIEKEKIVELVLFFPQKISLFVPSFEYFQWKKSFEVKGWSYKRVSSKVTLNFKIQFFDETEKFSWKNLKMHSLF